MSELDVVFAKINIIKNCLTAIEKARLLAIDPAFVTTILELNLQRSIQASIDLANVVIAKEGLGLPTTYAQSFSVLEEHRIISASAAKVMKSMVGFRNVSVHDYRAVKPEIVRSIVETRLGDFEEYYAAILSRARGWS